MGCLGSSYGVWFTFNSSNYDTFTFNVENISGGEIGFVMFEGADCSSLTTVAGCQVTGTCAGSVEDFLLVENTDYYFLLYNTDAATCGEFEFTTTGVILSCTDAQLLTTMLLLKTTVLVNTKVLFLVMIFARTLSLLTVTQ